MTTPVPELDGCPWPVDPACLEDDWESTFDEETKARAVALAGNTLRRLTGYRVGGCPVTYRPCLGSSGCWQFYHWSQMPGGYGVGGSPPWFPLNWNGTWSNVACGCASNCTHTPGKRIALPAPVGRVDDVDVDGNPLVAGTDYWLDGNDLVRLGAGTWPLTQDMDLMPGSVGTFTVTYLNSYPVDGMGAYACGKLAMEYARACSGEGKCSLPATVTQVVRQGVSYSLPAGSFPNGETGIREVDAYIAMWNPSHRKTRPRVIAP